MTFSFDLREETEALKEISTYEIPNEQVILSMNAGQVNELVERAVHSIADSSENITEPETFDIIRSFLKNADALQGSHMSKILDILSSGLHVQTQQARKDLDHQADADTLQVHRLPLEIYAFLLSWFVDSTDRVKSSADDDVPAPKPRRGRGGKATAGRGAAKRDTWSWEQHIPITLKLIEKVLALKLQRIWMTGPERDTFLYCITRPAYHLWNSEVYMKSAQIKEGIFNVIHLAVKNQGQTLHAQIMIMQGLQHEHLSEPLAECLDGLATEYHFTQLGEDVLREIAGLSFSSQDAKSPRFCSRFLIAFAEKQPKSVLKQISLLLNHLDSDSYPMRMAIVEIMGSLIRYLASDSEEWQKDRESTQKQIVGLYDLLLERTLDLSTYVRAKVYQVFTKLLRGGYKFPKQRLAITRSAISALDDKAPSVRKVAIITIVELICTHPYTDEGGMLVEEDWQERYDKTRDELAKLEGRVGKVVERDSDEDSGVENSKAENSEAPKSKKKSKGKKKLNLSSDDEMEVDEEEEEEEEPEPQGDDDDTEIVDSDEPSMKDKRRKRRKSELDLDALGNEQAAVAALESTELMKLRLTKKYCAEALNFVKQIDAATTALGDLLGSKSKPEVLETIEFFRVAHEYKLQGSASGIRKMLHLIWSKDINATTEDGKELKGVRQGLLDCYNSLYFEPLPDLDPRQQTNRVAKNMIELTYEASLAELTSLEELLRTMMLDNRIHPDVIKKLWQVYSSDKPLSRQQRRGAIMILGMLAVAKREVVTDHVDILLKIGLGQLGKADLVLAKHTCVALQRLNGSVKKVKGSLVNQSLRIEMDSPIFRKMEDMVEHPCRSKEWFPLAEQVINTVYALGDHPDALCDMIIKEFTRRAFRSRKTDTSVGPRDLDAMDEDQDIDATQKSDERISTKSNSQGSEDVGDSFDLSQLVFVVGHVAIKHIAHLELIEREWKRQKDERDAAEKKVTGGDSRASMSKDGEELDQVAGNAEDDIGDRMAAVRETELLFDEGSLLKLYGPMIMHIAGSPDKFKNPVLRAAAILSFSKFLCISSKFCADNAWLLFRIQETSKDPANRSNVVIALGDVAVCFSTLIDEDSNRLYKGLSDSDLIVKKNTLMVLTHLILNGMIKVKGQLGELAKCLEDQDHRIADLAKMFFSQLSTKDNAIYNNLPDVISHLSIGEHAVEEEVFQTTMKYIFTFIEKEKQAENIVEKLCQRFRLSEEPRQWRDVAFCLSLLPYKSERSVKKLIEGLPYYRDKLHVTEVFDRFAEILTKARSNKAANKPETELNEFEQILEDHKKQGQDDQEFEKKVAGRKVAAKKRATRRATRKKTRVRADDDEEEE